MQRTLAMELQKLSVQFRKQQKKYLMDISQRDGASGGFAVLEETGRRTGQDEEYDPGFSETQARGSELPTPLLHATLIAAAAGQAGLSETLRQHQRWQGTQQHILGNH